MQAANPARGLNLVSAIWGAVTVGLFAGLTSTLMRSLAAGVAGALLLAFSYTFWSQAIIAEVYTLHLALMGACLCLYIPVSLLLNGIVVSYTEAAWTLTYMRLVRPQDNAPVIIEANA